MLGTLHNDQILLLLLLLYLYWILTQPQLIRANEHQEQVFAVTKILFVCLLKRW